MFAWGRKTLCAVTETVMIIMIMINTIHMIECVAGGGRSSRDMVDMVDVVERKMKSRWRRTVGKTGPARADRYWRI